MSKKLKDAVKTQKKSTKQKVQQIYGLLGIPLGGTKLVEVPTRNSYLYVRLRNNQSEVIQAFNNQVAPSYNLPVIVERQGNRYTVVSVDTQRYENNWNSFAPFLPRHGNTHSFDIEGGGAGDITWVYPRQFMPLLVLPSGSNGGPNVIVSPYTLKNDAGTWKYVGNTGTQNITTYNPSSPSGAVMVLVYLDTESGNPYLLVGSGSYFSNTITGANAVVPYIPSITNANTQIPLAAVRLITGSSRLSWDNIYDVRQFVHNVPTGTGGGGGSFTWNIQDEGVSQGTATTLNVISSVADISVSGSVARLFITGSPGGGISNVAVQDDGVAQGNATTFNFVGDMVDASVSGTVARIFISGSCNDLGRTYFFDTNLNEIPHFTMTPDRRLSSSDSLGNSGALSSADTLVQTFSTETKFPNATYLNHGIYHMHLWARNGTNPSKNVIFYWQLYQRDTSGTETLIGTSLNSRSLSFNASLSEEVLPLYLDTGVDLALSDRLVVKIYASPIGAGADPTLRYGYAGQYRSRIEISTSTREIDDGWEWAQAGWSFVSADAPSYVIAADDNVTGSVGLGMKLQLTHQSSVKNFIITQVRGITGSSTQYDVYGGTDFTLNVTGAITNVKYSMDKAPPGFNTSPDKWTVSTVTSDSPTISSPTSATWYGGSGLTPTGPSLAIPIGSWRVFYRVIVDVSITLAGVAAVGARVTLSTANNSESDVEITSAVSVSMPIGAVTQRATYISEKNLTLLSKTSYFLNMFTGNTGATSMVMNTAGVFRNVIKAVCAFL